MAVLWLAYGYLIAFDIRTACKLLEGIRMILAEYRAPLLTLTLTQYEALRYKTEREVLECGGSVGSHLRRHRSA